jgi:hypothetical protein
MIIFRHNRSKKKENYVLLFYNHNTSVEVSVVKIKMGRKNRRRKR